jgi:modification methylase
MDPLKYKNKVFYKNSNSMEEVPDESIDLIVTSPPYFNIKDYDKDGHQNNEISKKEKGQIGDIDDYKYFISEMLLVWKECFRVLRPNGKLAINAPLMPMKKEDYCTHYNRQIFNISSDIEHSILNNINGFYLLDVYVWNRINSSKGLMFGSYPYPRNFYAQNTIEFINIYVKEGIPEKIIDEKIKNKSKLSIKEWNTYTKQVWNIAIPNKKDVSYGKHSAIMPEEIVKRCVKLYSFVGDVVLDPFAGSGTTLKVAKELKRGYVGYEISEGYKNIIEEKINSILFDMFEDFW